MKWQRHVIDHDGYGIYLWRVIYFWASSRNHHKYLLFFFKSSKIFVGRWSLAAGWRAKQIWFQHHSEMKSWMPSPYAQTTSPWRQHPPLLGGHPSTIQYIDRRSAIFHVSKHRCWVGNKHKMNNQQQSSWQYIMVRCCDLVCFL